MTESAVRPRSRTRLWLDLARAGNFPSVWSNVLAALVLSQTVRGEWPSPSVLVIALIAGSLAYAGGTTLNDVADVAFDSVHRPERAIPRGRVARSTAAWVGGAELAIGLSLLIAAGASVSMAVGLAATIVAYDWVHKHWSGSVVLMAGCRVLLALTLASLPGHELRTAFVVWIAGLFVYIVGLSWLARREYLPGAPAARLGRLVGRLLAFMPLVDAIALLWVGAWWPAVACAAAVPLGRWAQRQAAST
ncbi:MAG: UbiA family prenyltransferase [Opitutus sp.]